MWGSMRIQMESRLNLKKKNRNILIILTLLEENITF